MSDLRTFETCLRYRKRNESTCKPDSVPVKPAAAIHLRLPLPAAWCSLPANLGGPPSTARAVNAVHQPLGFAPGGVYLANRVTPIAGGLLHHRFSLTAHEWVAVYSLLHFPADHSGWALPITLPCGVRTFLDIWPMPRPPGRLVPDQNTHINWISVPLLLVPFPAKRSLEKI